MQADTFEIFITQQSATSGITDRFNTSLPKPLDDCFPTLA
jgi:hypothetical protein